MVYRPWSDSKRKNPKIFSSIQITSNYRFYYDAKKLFAFLSENDFI
jgi:hypothetical protein